ncbi:MAG: metal-dependent transcriptional regulator [Verrucomicrobiota bacterium]|nr:metal-dependent transcriptional regulator [Verrucomicrobiota bacterium]
MPTSTVENYLKQILIVSLETNCPEVPMGKVAQGLSVTSGTATTMIKNLAENEWLHYYPRRGVRLTRKGKALAMNILRRHRLLETFLVETLGLDWSEIHQEAEELEHAISEKVLEKLDEFLGRPRQDPHGHPIPTRGGVIRRSSTQSLLSCKAGSKVTIESITDQESDFLKFARKKQLFPGQVVSVLSHEKLADAITLQVGGAAPFSLGSKSSEKILVQA